MSIINTLAQFAVANNNARPTTTPVYELGIEEARAAVKCVDSAKTKAEDGSQALSLRLGRRKLPLDIIAPKAAVINTPADKVEEFTTALLDLVADGSFDAAIVEVQGLLKETAEAPKVSAATKATNSTPEGLDLSELEELEEAELTAEAIVEDELV